MTKEDAGREERFLHTEIDAKDIDTLFDPKVLTDFRYIDKDGERKLTKDDDIEFFDENGDLKQNLLIKGNNLLALHTLHEKLAGRVKLIYIDPPYNTGNDGFKYNDDFNHSSWLTFMKNRLEVAKTLLCSSGTIMVHCDDHEQAYLKVLMDEIFGRDFYVSSVPRITSFQRSGQEKYMNVSHDYIVIYSWNLDFNNAIPREYKDSEIKKDDIGHYIEGDTKAILAAQSQGYSKNGDYDFVYKGKTYKPIDKNGKRNRWLWVKDRMEAAAKLGILRETASSLRVQLYLDKKFEEGSNTMVDKDTNLKLHTADFMTKSKFDNPTGINELTAIMGQKVPDMTPKPEALISTLIALATDKNDIVVDYHLGSGTTSAVAHKMNRRWIGVEQMGYIKTVTTVRLKKVIDGEQGGISKDVNWQGGGSFVYFELKKYNQDFIDRIMEAASIPELEEIYEDMQKNAFLKFWFDKKEFEKDEKFRKLDIDGRKQALVDILDENQFYLNYDEMEDSKYHVTEDEKALTNRFYQESDKPEELENAEE